MVKASQDLLEPLYGKLHAVSLKESRVPEGLGLDYIPPAAGEAGEEEEGDSKRELTDEEFWSIPQHLRGLDRVMDPKAPSFMASG